MRPLAPFALFLFFLGACNVATFEPLGWDTWCENRNTGEYFKAGEFQTESVARALEEQIEAQDIRMRCWIQPN